MEISYAYEALAQKIDGYASAFGVGGGVISAELVKQAYILYFSAYGYPDGLDKAVEAGLLARYAAGLLDKNGAGYDQLIYSVAESMLGGEIDLSYVAGLLGSLLDQRSEALSYEELSAMAAELLGLAGVELDAAVIKDAVEQAYVLYAYNAGDLSLDTAIRGDAAVAFALGLVDKDDENFNRFIADAIIGADGRTLELLALAADAFADLSAPMTYSEMTQRLGGYMADPLAAELLSGLGLDIGGADAIAGLLEQAFILYQNAHYAGMPSESVATRQLIAYIFSLFDKNSQNYNALFYGVADRMISELDLGMSTDNLLWAAKYVVNSLYSSIERPMSYNELNSYINGLIFIVGGVLPDGLEIDGFDPVTLEQVYVFKLISDGLMPSDGVLVYRLVDFVFLIIGDPLIASFADADTIEGLLAYKASLDSAETMFKSDAHMRMVFTFDIDPSDEETFKFIDGLSAKAKEIFGEEAYVAGMSVVLNDMKNSFEKDMLIISIFSIALVFLIIALIYKSLIIPLILVLLIQAAIWISFGMSTIAGTPMYFVSYVLVTCIQMGAAIDYGILLSGRYLYNRRFMNKKDAVQCAVKESIKTILTSGSILIISGFVIYVVATSVAISSIGNYIFRGVSMSVFLTVFILPQLLMLFDKAIQKTTRKNKFYNGKKTIENGDYKFFNPDGSAVSLESQADERG
jgi:hypothetical protein